MRLSDLRGVLRHPAGYTAYDPGGAGSNSYSLCDVHRSVTRATKKNSLRSSLSAGAFGPYSAQILMVFRSAAEAQAYQARFTAGTPCTARFSDGTVNTYGRRSRAGSFTITAQSTLPGTGILDAVAVRNVVYEQVDLALGGGVDAAAHDARTAKVVSLLRSR